MKNATAEVGDLFQAKNSMELSTVSGRIERQTIIRILNYLIDRDILKIAKIEGLSDYFEELEAILKKYRLEKTIEWRDWLKYWTEGIHSNHITKFPDNKDFRDCTNEYCLAAQQTLQELGS